MLNREKLQLLTETAFITVSGSLQTPRIIPRTAFSAGRCCHLRRFRYQKISGSRHTFQHSRFGIRNTEYFQCSSSPWSSVLSSLSFIIFAGKTKSSIFFSDQLPPSRPASASALLGKAAIPLVLAAVLHAIYRALCRHDSYRSGKSHGSKKDLPKIQKRGISFNDTPRFFLLYWC